MYIVPDTIIKFMNVNLDQTYQHTIYFETKADQTTYFLSKAEITREDKYFQRYTRNSLIIDVPVQNMYDKNYMMFKNGGFSNKWFYAFILNVEWKSLTSCIISYQLDVLQTWYFDFTIHPSFVLREHSSTDVAGDNIVPEPISADIQYINAVSEQQITCIENYVLTTAIPTWNPPDTNHPNGYYSFVAQANEDIRSGIIMPYESKGLQDIGNGTPQDLIQFLETWGDEGQMQGILGVQPRLKPVTVSLSRPSAIGGYIPRNKKLLTGQFCRYTFELAGNQMEVPLDVVPNPTVTSEPRGAIGAYTLGLGAYRVYLTNYGNAVCPTSMGIEIPVPVVKWAFNDYANTTALQADATAKMLTREQTEHGRDFINAGINVGTGVLDTASTLASPKAIKGIIDPFGTASSAMRGIQQATNAGIDMYENVTHIDKHSEAISRHHANMRAPATGASAITNVLASQAQLYLSGYVWTVLRQDAERIDKYFDMYGYAVNQLKQPNFTARPHWNYIQTSGLEVTAQCPTGDMEYIKQIFNNGITFWKDGDEIGDYSLDNSIQ